MKYAMRMLCLTLTVAVSGRFLPTARALTTSWNTNLNGIFTTATNWNNGVPTSVDAAVFDRNLDIAYNVTFPGSLALLTRNVKQLRIGKNTVSFADSLSFGQSPAKFSVDAGNTLGSDGIIVGEAAGQTAGLFTTLANFSGIGATIGKVAASTGTLNVTGGTFSLVGALSGGRVLVGYGGTGAMNINSGASVNIEGVDLEDAVRVGVLAGSHGTLNVSGAKSTLTITDSGSFGEFLEVGSSGTGILNIMGGGHVNDVSSSVAAYEGSTGTVTVDGAGSVWANSSYITVGDRSDGTLTIQNAGQVTSSGAFIGDAPGAFGTITVDGAGSTWTSSSGGVYVGAFGDGALAIRNGGHVISSGVQLGYATGILGTVTVDGTGSTWTNSGGLNLGVAGAGALTIRNGGHVTSSGALLGGFSGSEGLATIDGSGSNWTISGNLVVGNGATGTLTVSDGGTVSVSGLLYVANGTVKGNGNIAADINNAGVVSPGTSPGALHIDGNYTQVATGKLKIELGGTTPGSQYDELLVSGAATLNGSLQVFLISGFAPSLGDIFAVVNSTGGITGSFADNSLPSLAGGLVLNLNYEPNQVTLSVDGVLGDYNHNGIVDAADYLVWRKTRSQSGAGLAADGNGNGTVDSGDYNVWRTHFGQTAGSGSGVSANASVPEPSTLVLLIFAVAGWCLRRGRTA